jgi:hypothetical protein
MVLSGVQGVHSVINGLYSPTQETGQDGRIVYRKIADAAWCIEHYDGEWQVKAESDRCSGSHVASVEGGCALEDCRESHWSVYNSKKKFKVQNVKISTEEEAKSQVSGHVNYLNTTQPDFYFFSQNDTANVAG